MHRCLILMICILPLVAQEPKKPDENDTRWHASVRDVATGYKAWMRLEDEMRWAPWLCPAPMPAPGRFSRAKKDTPHARKLYTLYAKDPVAYGAKKTGMGITTNTPLRKKLAAFDQVLVKEAWVPERMKQAPSGHPLSWSSKTFGKSRLRPTKRGEHWYRADKQAGLFVMMHLTGKPTAATDAGWVYATVTNDGKITGAGRMQSCMSCHTKQADRLFGLPKPAAKK